MIYKIGAVFHQKDEGGWELFVSNKLVCKQSQDSNYLHNLPIDSETFRAEVLIVVVLGLALSNCILQTR